MNVRVAALLASVVAGSASAVIVPIDEFTGTMSEGFENIFSPGGYPGPIPLFSGAATMDDTLAHFCVISFVWSGPGGEVLPYNGNLFGGTVAGPTLFQFAQPATDFGGFMTTVGALPGGTAVFRDAAGGIIGTVPVNNVPVEWRWQGWHSDTPFSSIEITGANVPGISMQYDDLQVTFVPAPGVLGLLAGAALIGRRRR